MFELTLEISEEQLEQPYNHVHHSTALRLLERGRIAFLESRGFPLSWFFERDILLVISEIRVQYFREIRAGTISVTCQHPEVDERSIIIPQAIINERGKLAVGARVSSVCMNIKTRRGIDPPEQFLRSLCG